jgi:16S rRNA (uracil1498-N3)-methyltransferase
LPLRWFNGFVTRRRWIADEFSGNHAAVTGPHAGHLVRVLRARIGQEFDIATGAAVRRGLITGIDPDKDRVEFELGEEVPVATLPHVTIALSIFKFDRMEWAIEKCTELGVARIVPVIARRTEAHLAAAASKRVERWERIVRQASEQSRRTSPPEVSQPMKLKEAASLAGGTRIVLAENERDHSLRDALLSHAFGADIVLAGGPEGGWTKDDEELFREANWTMASLGGTILRAETAVIAALAVVMAEVQ